MTEQWPSTWSEFIRWLRQDWRRAYRLVCIIVTVLVASTLGILTGMWLAETVTAGR